MSLIVVGGVVGSFDAIAFNFIGVSYMLVAIVSHAVRLVMTQTLLGTARLGLSSMMTLYYFAPLSTFMVGFTALTIELPKMTMADIYNVGILLLLSNVALAFCLNVSTFFLVSRDK